MELRLSCSKPSNSVPIFYLWLNKALVDDRRHNIYNILSRWLKLHLHVQSHCGVETDRFWHTFYSYHVHICVVGWRNALSRSAMSVSIQYIPRNIHTVLALLCFVVVIHWLIFPYSSGLLHWHCGNLTIAPVPAKQPWWIWINSSCEFIMNDCMTTKQSTTKTCAYFLGYTVVLCSDMWFQSGGIRWKIPYWTHFFLNFALVLSPFHQRPCVNTSTHLCWTQHNFPVWPSCHNFHISCFSVICHQVSFCIA